jgi:nicotinamidase-related amidase
VCRSSGAISHAFAFENPAIAAATDAHQPAALAAACDARHNSVGRHEGSTTMAERTPGTTEAQTASDHAAPRSPELITSQTSRLLIVDVQDKLLALVPSGERLVHNCRRLLDAAKIVGVPAFATEQYPQGLGPTSAELASRLGSIPSKVCFSCAPALNWGTAAESADDRDQVVVAGMEAHVCVLQTVLDLLAAGFRVYVPADAVASRFELDARVAIERMACCGATITTVESVLFEWCERAGTPEFKQIQRLVIEG